MSLCRSVLLVLLTIFSTVAHADGWSRNELQWQVGRLDIPYSNDLSAAKRILTLQHADGWKYGENFFFIDFSDSNGNRDAYGEYYGTLSLGKIRDHRVGFGPVKDIGLLMGINIGRDAKVVKYLPGIRFSLDAPGFAFLNVDITGYIDDSQGLAHGGAPTEGDSFMIDVNGARPFQIGTTHWSISGHIEYIGGRSNEFGGRASSHILAQPQLRYDLGEALFHRSDELFIGIEYQYWWHKLGDPNTTESAPQALLVWHL